MNNDSDKTISRQANIGVGASFGAVVGAVIAAAIFKSPIYTITGSLVGAFIGGVINSKNKSNFSDMLWNVYSGKTGLRLFIASLFVSAMIFWPILVYQLDQSEPNYMLIFRLILIPISVIMAVTAMKQAFSELDDLQLKILREAIVIGFTISTSIVLILGMVDLSFPISSIVSFDLPVPISLNWLITFLILMTSMLIGRIVVAWRYR
jgi:hypothetical protein